MKLMGSISMDEEIEIKPEMTEQQQVAALFPRRYSVVVKYADGTEDVFRPEHLETIIYEAYKLDVKNDSEYIEKCLIERRGFEPKKDIVDLKLRYRANKEVKEIDLLYKPDFVLNKTQVSIKSWMSGWGFIFAREAFKHPDYCEKLLERYLRIKDNFSTIKRRAIAITKAQGVDKLNLLVAFMETIDKQGLRIYMDLYAQYCEHFNRKKVKPKILYEATAKQTDDLFGGKHR
jgi:hypothetical protein